MRLPMARKKAGKGLGPARSLGEQNSEDEDEDADGGHGESESSEDDGDDNLESSGDEEASELNPNVEDPAPANAPTKLSKVTHFTDTVSMWSINGEF